MGKLQKDEMHPEIGNNYCRNPDASGKRTWCYTHPHGHPNDELYYYDYCDPPTCDPNDYKWGVKGEEYRGCQTKAKSRTTCVNWDEAWGGYYNSANFPGSGLEGNNCRNPSASDETIWCYNTTTKP